MSTSPGYKQAQVIFSRACANTSGRTNESFGLLYKWPLALTMVTNGRVRISGSCGVCEVSRDAGVQVARRAVCQTGDPVT